MLVVPKIFFSLFKSSEFIVSNLALGTVIAMCLICLLKRLDKPFVKKVRILYVIECLNV